MRHALLIACAWLALPASGAAAAEPSGSLGADVRLARVRDAVAAAVARRFAVTEERVTVRDLRSDAGEGDDLVAVPDPGARTGRAVQFTLRSGPRRVGTAVATVAVAVPHVKVTAPVDRDASIAADAVQDADAEVSDVRFEALPTLDDVIGAHARRALVPGDVLSHAVVAVPDAVRAGDEVKVVARVGALEAWGVGRASGSGRVGDVVRITRGSARGLQRARVLSPGVVEVLLGQPQEIR
jgi:flagella basal body P-ring formation protein FlgA